MQFDAKIPGGQIQDKWDRHRFDLKLVNPSGKRHFSIIVVGTGLAGASAAAALGEQGYRVKSFCIQDSPRRAPGISAQGGINAAKNYRNDGDSIWRLFYDTVKGGDYRSREANVYRLAQISGNIIDHCVAQGIPFARDYAGMLANRSFGGAQVSRTFYARGQTGQQLLLGAYGSLSRQIAAGTVKMFTRREMLDVVIVNGRARGIVTRHLITGEIETYAADAVILATGGYGNVYNLSTNSMSSNATAIFRAYRRGAFFANPCFVQIHPTCIPVHGNYQSKLTLMSESLRNDGRVWVPKMPGDTRSPEQIPEDERDYFLERKYPAFGNLVPRDVASRNVKEHCDAGKGVGETGRAVYLDLSDAIQRDGRYTIEMKYGNLFEMYEKITGHNPYTTPMMIYPAVHYTMGGLWVDYNLMTTIPGLFAAGECNFSDHGANRLGASALMQGLADGYFILPYTIGGYLGGEELEAVTTEHPAFDEAAGGVAARIEKLLSIKGRRTVDDFHKALGTIVWEHCGMVRTNDGLDNAKSMIQELRVEFWENVMIPGKARDVNQSLERAGRMADYLELAELMVTDARHRQESCGSHFNETFQTDEHEARRDDDNFCYVAAYESNGVNENPELHKEPLTFEHVQLSQRSYQ